MIGTWSYPAPEEPSGLGYIHFSDDGRATANGSASYLRRDPKIAPKRTS